MTSRQQQVFHMLMAVSAALEKRGKQLRQAKASAEQAILDALIVVFAQDALEQVARTHDLERLQREKVALTMELNRGGRSLFGTATRVSLLAALRSVERQRRVHHLRRVAATGALALHEQAARALLRALHLTFASERRAPRRVASA